MTNPLQELIDYCVNFLHTTFFRWSWVKSACASTTAILYLFLGDTTVEFYTLFGLMIADLLIALIVVHIKKEVISSKKLGHTPLKIFTSFVVLSSLVSAQDKIGLPFAADIAAAMMIASQLISILEHAARFGIVLPIPLLKNLERIKEGKR